MGDSPENNNSPKRKDAWTFSNLMKRNLTKFPCEITEEVGSKFTGDSLKGASNVRLHMDCISPTELAH